MSTRARWALLLASIAAFLLCATGFSLLDRRDTAAGTALIVGTTLFGVLVHSLVRHQFLTGETVLKWRVAAFGLAIVLGVGLVWWWSNAPEAPDGFGLWGGVLVFIGLGLAVAELRRSKWASSRIGGLFAFIAALLLGLSFTLLAFGVTAGVIPMLAGGLLVLFVSMSLLSAVCNRRLKTWGPAKAALLLGVGLVLFGAAVLGASWATTVGLDYIGPIALVILVLMIATASRSNGDSAIALIGLLILTAATPTRVPGPRPPAGGKPVMVVLGDSFISGEGADHYFENTNVKERNTCRRAPTAYANRLVEEAPVLPYDLLFVACSGAKAHEVHQSGKERSPATDEKGLNQVALATEALAEAGVAVAQVPFVLLSIGGNDSLFGDIVQACLAPGDCSTLGAAWRANLQNMVGPLREAYGAVQSGFRGVPILVVPYPVPIAREKGSCDWTTFTPPEHRFLHDFTVEINSVIAATVAETPFTHLHYVDTMPPALIEANLALCAADPNRVGVNFLAINGVGGLIESSINPTNWIHNSMHPNKDGHVAMRRAVQDWVAGHADVRTGLPGAARRTSTPGAAAGTFAPIDPSGRCVDKVLGPPAGKVTEGLKKCTGEWTLDETSSFAAFPGVLLLLPLLTAWVVGLSVVRLARIAGAWLWDWGPIVTRRQQFGLR
ncbi:MAG: SGNH/GDSL hydrolase family protein [Acidimicrobiales bacterium]